MKLRTPVLVSAMKAFIKVMSSGGAGVEEARDLRCEACDAICAEIQEIIRVLLLTTPDESQLEMDDAALMLRSLVGHLVTVQSTYSNSIK